MYLSKLEIQGFKSFAEKAVLEFNHDLTAIVGPNGSGKSNIADAVRWVLGEQSLKLLRGKKSDDVIFAGSKRRSRLGFAEVSLHLNNADGTAPLDYREIVITRRIFRSGESEYLINKNKVRLTDIQLLLAKASFGQKTYSIIGQGMVDSILVSSPQERKEFFDEATGVRQYQLKREQAINKLERSEENLKQSQQVLLEIEPRLRSLTRQVRRLERKEEISKILNDLQLKYYTRLLNDLDQETNKFTGEINKLEKEKKELENKQQKVQKEIEQRQIQDTAAQAFQKLQDEYTALNNQKHTLLGELAVIKGKVSLELTKIGKTDLVWLNNKKTELENNLAEVTVEMEEKKRHLEKIQFRLNDKIAEQNKILEEFQKLQKQLLKAQEDLTKNESFSLAKIQSHLNSLYQKQQEFLEALDKIDNLNQLKKLKERAQEIAKEIRWLTNKLAENGQSDSGELIRIQEKLNQFLTTKDSLVNEIQGLKIDLETTKHTIQQLVKQQEKLTLENKKIEAEISHSSAAYSQEQINQELMSQKAELEKGIKEIDKKLEDLQKQLDDFSKNQAQSRNQLFDLQKSLRNWQIKLNSLNLEYNDIKINLAKIETKREELEKEITLEVKGEFKPLNEKININLGETYAEILRLKNQLAIIGGLDEEVSQEYQEVKVRHDFLKEQITDLREAILSCQQIIEELDEKIKEQFETAFEKINQQFTHYFKILFNGGTAKLLLQKKEIIEENNNQADNQSTPETDTITEELLDSAKKKRWEIGIEIQATPPGKRLKSLNMLSGGEKALTSIALIYAIIANNPPPFVVLDEVDAALDEANSDRFVKIIDELSDKTQFICITHNRATMHQAAILYGVTMSDDGVSKLLSINLTEAEEVAE